MIDEKLALVPHKPGCYLMHNQAGTIIYVGKSKNLKNRLTSYFRGKHYGKTDMLVHEITDFEYIVTSSERESLLLEINLIKKHTPKYNILLKDDKSYPYIEFTNEKIPRLLIVRNPNLKRSKNIFGPYPNVTAARKVVDILNRIYPLRKCRNYQNKKECLYYHIGECLGYCNSNIDENLVNDMKNEINSFLNGNYEIVTSKILKRMEECSSKLQYEKALEYKELLDYINITLEKQKVELEDNLNRDIIGYYTDNNYLSMQILFIRGGKLLSKKSNIFPMIDDLEEEVTTYITKFYSENKTFPKEVFVPGFIDKESLSAIFNIKFLTPQKGTKKQILDLAYENAKIYFNEQMTIIKRDEEKNIEALSELKKLLNIPSASRIEIFDNSNIFGSFNVSGMVVFTDGKPNKNEYRKYKITNDKNDDYGTMHEVIYRRYYRVLKDKLERPDLIIVDGGVGQLNIAREVLAELNLDIPSIGLKKDDKHSTNTIVGDYPIKEIKIDKSSNLFLLLTKMQDEVHNFTISYHKQIRSKGALSSALDSITGIGEVRKNKLLKKYHSITKMKEASLSELEEILPSDVAKKFYEILKEI